MPREDPARELPALECEVGPRSAQRLVEANGERAALLGDEHGVFEAWIWPIKVAHDLQIAVRGRNGASAAESARRVRVTPCEVAIEYGSGDWRVTLRAFAARERRAIALLFEVETAEPISLELSFVPDVKPMWPAGLGGQIAFVDPETGALALTEELGRFAALIGSPDAALLAVSADHSLPREPVALSIAVEPERAKRGPFTAFMAGAEIEKPPLSDAAKLGLEDAALGHARAHRVLALAREEYRWIERDWRDVRRANEEHWSAFLARTTRFESDDPRHTEAFEWAKIAIEKAWVRVDGVGRGLVAGLAKSGAGERPGFGWFFDGDAMIAARAMLAYGDFEGARAVLEFAASHQRADGKMMHELVLSARWCDWLGDYPYAYYKANNTPEFISTLGLYVSLTGDEGLANRLWPQVKKAYEHGLACIDDDGHVSNRKAGIAAVEAGPLVGKIRAEIFLHGLWIRALGVVEAMGRSRGESDLADEARRRRNKLRDALATFWSERHDRYAFAHLADGSRCDDLTAYQADSISLAKSATEGKRARATAKWLNTPELASDWGVRFFATGSSVYDPANYNTGAVFPYATNFSVLACFENGLTDAAHQLLASQIALHNFSGLGFVPEHLRGDRCEAPPRGVPHQIFSSAAIIDGTLCGMPGCSEFELAGRGTFVCVTPALPARCNHVRFSRMRTRSMTVELALTRTRALGRTRFEAMLRIESSQRSTYLTFQPCLPLLSRDARFLTGDDERGFPCELRRRGGSLHPWVLEESRRRHGSSVGEQAVAYTYQSGPELLLDDSPLVEGATSSRFRVCEVEHNDEKVEWTLWGLAGQTYRIGWRSDRKVEFEGARVIADELEITFPGGPEGTWTSTKLRAVALD